MNIPAIKIFDTAYARAERLLNRNEGKKGDALHAESVKDDLRAAVVFTVAAIDAFFKVKIIEYLKCEREKNPSNFDLSLAAETLIKGQISMQRFGSEFKDLKKPDKELVMALIESKKSSVIGYFDDAVKKEAYQSLNKIDEAFKLMGKNPAEIWNRVDAAIKTNPSIKKIRGISGAIETRGRKTDAKVQLENLFERRHLIVHEADIFLTSLKSGGRERPISYEAVNKWALYSGVAIREIDKVIK